MSLRLLLLILYLFTNIGFDFSPYESSGPTRSAPLNYYYWNYPDRFEHLESSSTDIDNFLIEVWGLAKNDDVIVDRTYLYSLAIDLYESLSVGNTLNENGVVSAGKGYHHERMYGAINFIGYSAKGAWLTAVNKNSQWRKEVSFLKQYLRDNIELSAPNVEAVILAEDLNLLNPTNYSSLQRWMASMATAIENNIPPWEAEEYNRNNGIVTFSSEDAFELPSSTAVSEPVTAAVAATGAGGDILGNGLVDGRQGTQGVSDETVAVAAESADEDNELMMWAALVAVVLGVVGVVVSRRKG